MGRKRYSKSYNCGADDIFGLFNELTLLQGMQSEKILERQLDNMFDDISNIWNIEWEREWKSIWNMDWNSVFWEGIGKHLPIRVSTSQEKGRAGERLIASILNQLPKDEYHVMNDVLLEIGDTSSQIDHIVISQYGVFVIETKNYAGIVSGTMISDKWIQEKDDRNYEFYNPILQNQKHCQAIARCIGMIDNPMFVPIVVFSKNCVLNVLSDVPVLYSDDLIAYIDTYKEKLLSAVDVETFRKRLEGYNNPSYAARQRHVRRAKYAKYKHR